MTDAAHARARGGRRANSGRKAVALKVKSTYPIRTGEQTKAAVDAGVAISPEILDDARRIARTAMHLQKREMITRMGELGLAPLDILQSCMLMLYERALDARAAGGVLIVEVENKPSVFETEAALLIAASDVANKAAQYVHPKLVAVDAQVTELTYEERLEQLAELDGSIAKGSV